MKAFVALLACLGVVASAGLSDCKDRYAQRKLTDPAHLCDSLVALELCMVTQPATVAVDTELENDLLMLVHEDYIEAKCTYVHISNNAILKEEGNLKISSQDFRVRRGADDVQSIWALSEQVNNLETSMSKVAASIDLPEDIVTNDEFNTLTSGLTTKTEVRDIVRTALSDSITAIQNTLNSASAAFDTVYKPVATAAQAVTVTKDSLGSLTSGSDAILDEIRIVLENAEIDIPDEIDALKVIETDITSITASLDNAKIAFNTKKASVTTNVNNALAALDVKINSLNSKVNTLKTKSNTLDTSSTTTTNLVKSLKSLTFPRKVYIWSGYCPDTNQNTGFQKYCTKNVFFNTMDPHFKLATDGIFEAITTGWYRINWRSSTYQNSGQCDCQIVVNGNVLHKGNNYHFANYWWENLIDKTVKINKGEQFFIQVQRNAGSGLVWQGGSSTGDYTHLEIQFLGI